ncbi:hypothetical protein CJ030_MR6G019611 [Morella rubra]|uniref:DNA repair RAD52-like protein 1, mitochondrial n=1 Tax=Morella rubra TaxID=262757 RepID=A0A6A1VGR0_9ROSI|nr:hypothetical protein CJ030_MR6G019611 [Morella rubra]
MAFSSMKSLGKALLPFVSSSSSSSSSKPLLVLLLAQSPNKYCFWFRSSSSSSSRSSSSFSNEAREAEDDDVAAGSSGISRPLSEVLKELNKKVPDSLIKTRLEDGFSMKYVPWHIVNRIMNLHAPEWSGEVRSITYSADGRSVSVVYRVTIYGTDAEFGGYVADHFEK